MTGTRLFLRRAAIFGTIAVLGTVLAWMLSGGRRGGGGRDRPSLGVVDIPGGTLLGGADGLPSVTVVEAERLLVGTVRPVTLDDGTVLPFRTVLFRGDSERPLPSPAPGVGRLSVTAPVVVLREEPRTRAEYEAGGRGTSRFEAPEGILEHGPGEALRMSLSGGVTASSDRDGTAWTFRSPAADVDLRTRALAAPGEVQVASRGLEIRGRDLRARDDDRSLLLEGGAAGFVERARGTGLDGAEPDRPRRVDFRCAGPFRIVPRPPPPGAPEGLDRFRILLEREALVRQGDGSLAADRIEIDLVRDPSSEKEDAEVEEIRAYGAVALEAGAEGRRIRATCGRLLARPRPDGFTAVSMEESPRLLARLSPGEEGGTLDVSGTGAATFLLPREDGSLSARFTDGARATQVLPAAPGSPAVRRDLAADTLSVEAARIPGGDGKGELRVDLLRAEGSASLAEGERTARADVLLYAPRSDGGATVTLDGNVAVSWPAAGGLDPLAALRGGAPSRADGEGALLLSSPGTVRLSLPPEGGDGAGFAVDGGGTVRRVVGEREIYRLTARTLEADLDPENRAVRRLLATGDVRFAGRGEGPAGRRYAFSGPRLEVTGGPGSREPRLAILQGEGADRARAELTAEDGHPFTLVGDRLRFDRESGRFRAEGRVAGEGILPEGRGPGAADAGARPATLECDLLEGTLAAGDAEGSTRVSLLEARGAVRVRTSGDEATGEALRYDRTAGTIRLTGSPARVASRARGSGTGGLPGLEDFCEAADLTLLLRDGALVEARAEEGGRFVVHRIPAPGSDGGAAVPAERLEVLGSGPLVHRPDETTLSDRVTLIHSVHRDGAFRERDRMDGADEIRAFHPAAKDGTRTLRGALALSPSGGIGGRSREAGWRASGISRVEMDADRRRVAMESSREAPRFRLVMASGTETWCRRAVYDYDQGTFPETVGASVRGEDGR